MPGLVADVADGFGLTGALSVAMAATKQRRRGHDRGEVLVDLAMTVADRSEAFSDVAVLPGSARSVRQGGVGPTAGRTLAPVDNETLQRIKVARGPGACRGVVGRCGSQVLCGRR